MAADNLPDQSSAAGTGQSGTIVAEENKRITGRQLNGRRQAKAAAGPARQSSPAVRPEAEAAPMAASIINKRDSRDKSRTHDFTWQEDFS